MPDADFERTFADLAHASLRDRAPILLDHLVGFQLLDKSDDDSHAVVDKDPLSDGCARVNFDAG